MAETSPASLLEHAIEAERHLEQLATGLAKAGADEQMVAAFTKMASVCRQVAKTLGNEKPNPPEAEQSPEQAGEQTANPEQAGGQEAPPQGRAAQRQSPFEGPSRDLSRAAQRNRR